MCHIQSGFDLFLSNVYIYLAFYTTATSNAITSGLKSVAARVFYLLIN